MQHEKPKNKYTTKQNEWYEVMNGMRVRGQLVFVCRNIEALQVGFKDSDGREEVSRQS